jgi:hypothetical protein
MNSLHVFGRLLATLTLAWGLATAAAAAAPQAGTIEIADGLVVAMNADGAIRLVEAGTPLNIDDSLLTGDESWAVVRFPDGGELVVARDSYVRLRAYAWDGKTGRNDMDILLGAVRWTGGKLPPGTVTLTTPEIVTTTLGTQIVMIVFPDGSTDQGVWDGGAKVRRLSNNKEYTLPKGRGASFKKGGGTDEFFGYRNWDQKTTDAWNVELNKFLEAAAKDPYYASNNPLFDWAKIWDEILKADTNKNSNYIPGKDGQPPVLVGKPKSPSLGMADWNQVQNYDGKYYNKLRDAVFALNDYLQKTDGRLYTQQRQVLEDARDAAVKAYGKLYPNTLQQIPDAYDTPLTAPKGKIKNGNVTEMGIAVDVPRTSIYDDPTISDTYSVFKGSWEEGLEPGIRQRTVSARYAAKTALDNLKANTSAIGSGSGLRSFDSGSDPDDRNNDVPVGIFLVNSNNLQETAWAVIEGGTVNFYEGDAYGPIRAPGGGYIEALNNDGRFQAVMVKEFKLGDNQRLFSLQGFAKFVTTEFPQFIGSQFNDTTSITLTTPGGQSVTLSGAQLFGASVNTSNFTAVSGLPAPLSAWSGGGETEWQALFQRLRVAPGGRVRITVTVNNVGDRNYPSTTLLGGLKGSGSR